MWWVCMMALTMSTVILGVNQRVNLRSFDWNPNTAVTRSDSGTKSTGIVTQRYKNSNKLHQMLNIVVAILQFILIVAASSVGEDLFYRADVHVRF